MPIALAKTRHLLTLALRLGLSILFVYSALAKLPDPQAFATDIDNYRLLPAWMVAPIAITLPGVELAAGLCLLVPRLAAGAAWLVVCMMAVFSIGVVQALWRGINLECGCFGATQTPVTVTTLLRDLGLLSAAVLCALETTPRHKQRRA